MAKRLFVSVGIPEETAQKLIFVAETAASEMPGKVQYRITKPDNLHFTINFLGSQEEGIIPVIERAIREASGLVGDINPKMLLREVDYADTPRADMVWVYAESAWMTEFAAILANILRRERISFDKKPFKAHLTLARMKIPTGIAMPDIRTEIGEEVRIKSVELTESILKPDGPVYMTVFSEKTTG